MKRWLWLGAFGLSIATTYAADDGFSKALPAEDFKAAGLSKLSSDELRQLDALVRDYKSGALAAAQREAADARAKALQAEADARAATAKAQQAEKDAQARAAAAETSSQPGLLERAKVLLKPGTRIEYTVLETKLANDFTGWERNTVFTLENGQRWRVQDGTSYVGSTVRAPKAKIVPGVLGSFWLEIEGVSTRVKVKQVEDR